MENQSLVEIINRFTALDKVAVATVADRIIEEYDSGNVNPHEFTEKLEFMLQSIEKAMASIREKETDFLLRAYGDTQARQGITAPGGSTIKVKEVGIRYDYSNTTKWAEMQTSIDALVEQRKELENQLKTITKSQKFLDEETGELVEFNPAIRTSKTSLEISLKKDNKLK
jgi:hypothetical protein